MPPEGVHRKDRSEILSYEEITALVVWLRDEFGLSKVRITGGEPLVRPNVERLIGLLAERGIPDLAMTTNGLRLAQMAPVLKRAGLTRVNVSLDSLSSEVFHRLTGGDVQDVLSGIAAALEHGMQPVKLNTVVIRGVNDAELRDLVAFAIREGCEIRFIELMPIGPGAALFAEGFLSSAAVLEALSGHFTIEPARPAFEGSARRYQATDTAGRRGTVGFISSCSAPFCAGCNRLRITADGRLLGCLARDGGISVRELLRAGERDAVCRVARDMLLGKTANRVFEQPAAMSSIGG